MKRNIALALIAALAMTFGACGPTASTSESTSASVSVSAESAAETSAASVEEVAAATSSSSDEVLVSSSEEAPVASASSPTGSNGEDTTTAASGTLAEAASASGDMKSVIPNPDEYFTDQESTYSISDGQTFSTDYEFFNPDEYNAYVQALKDAGFTLDPTETNSETYHEYKATSSDGSIIFDIVGGNDATLIYARAAS